MLGRVNGHVGPGVTAKAITLSSIGRIGTAGCNGHVIEYAGEAIEDLSMEGRMTICNMAIEGGARAGLVAVDAKTIAYVKGRPFAPKPQHWGSAVASWQTRKSGSGAGVDTPASRREEGRSRVGESR